MTAHTMLEDRTTVEALLGALIRAPSSHNTQPWLVRLYPDALDLIADRTRALPVNDPDDRELTISCGAALLNLRIAAAAAGYACAVRPLPDAADVDLLARVALQPAGGTAQPDAALQPAIAARRTYRQRFAPATIEHAAVQALVDAARHEGATLSVLDTPERRLRAAELVAEGDAAQWADPRWRRELAAWMHPRREGDGLAMPTLAVPVAQAVVRTFDMGHGVGAKDRQLADESPLLAVLWTDGDQPADWLAAGQALQRVLLTGVGHGLQASYLNQPVQVAALRPKLQQLTGRPGYAQLLLRLGVPAEVLPPAPRRPMADIVVTE